MRRMFSKNQIEEMVGQGVQADKEVISKITHEDNTTIFPKGVLPLHIYEENADFSVFFDYSTGNILDEDGLIEGGTIQIVNNCVILDEFFEVDSLEYILFDGDFDKPINTYDLCRSGTQLYRHTITFTTDDEIDLISNISAPISSNTQVEEHFTSLYLAHMSTSNYGSGVVLAMSSNPNSIEITYVDNDEGTQTLTEVFGSDVVTPL